MDFAKIWPYLVLILLIVIARRLWTIADILSGGPQRRKEEKEAQWEATKEDWRKTRPGFLIAAVVIPAAIIIFFIFIAVFSRM